MTAEPAPSLRRRLVQLSAGEELIEGPLKGYHHETYAFPLPDTYGRVGSVRWKCREPRQGILWFDRRSFASEGALIRALAGHVTSVPEIIEVDDIGLQRFIEGSTLGSYGRPGAVVAEPYVDQIARLFRELAAISPDMLPVSQATGADDRVVDGDSAGFAARLIQFTEERVYKEHLQLYGDLFDGLGIPQDGLRRLMDRTRSFASRPFCLLHGDLHRENFIVDGAGRLWTIDWELATFGDPLYDLATHLHLMRYPVQQEATVLLHWRDAMEAARPGSSLGWQEDLPYLLEYKRAQSVYTDVIRSALAVGGGRDFNWSALRSSSRKVQRVLADAESALSLTELPTLRQVAKRLVDWHRAGRGNITPSAP
ncbi:phosphotransferase [Streptomyces sp. ISL-1]|uniref:phosphotransferase n=1 Tax=Streptomyces sp. ISL-1 TaxID=2817657 RepID=UPI001BECECD5|nr:phosphotransferase [Streptomyces sp. ISL-1]MBT2391258.1 phosphotransferase [Streptomyces sp. ISL-1]